MNWEILLYLSVAYFMYASLLNTCRKKELLGVVEIVLRTEATDESYEGEYPENSSTFIKNIPFLTVPAIGSELQCEGIVTDSISRVIVERVIFYESGFEIRCDYSLQDNKPDYEEAKKHLKENGWHEKKLKSI